MVEIRDLRKSFGETVALDGLTLGIESGEVFGLLGPNGAGKTTTVNIVAGLLKPDAGSVSLKGIGPPSRPGYRSAIGLAPQSIAVYEELSAEENLTFFGRMHQLSGVRLGERVAWALDFVGLAERKSDRVRKYSGGMKRRLNLAVALLHDPPLLLLDEPTVGVDPQSRNAIFDKIERLRDGGKTILYTTHYIEEAQRLCGRVGILDRGKLLALDTVEELIRSYGGKSRVTAFTQDGAIRVETEDPAGELAKLSREKRLGRITVEAPNLETVFLNLTGKNLRD